MTKNAIAALFSSVIPGLGQIIKGEITKGVFFFTTMMFMTMTSMSAKDPGILCLIGGIIYLYIVMDAFISGAEDRS